ncbi:hypothetical protein SteCoe_8721 [Stentor coeruleus]|uniref:Uncharacterized protein n=1 Tax=Stentor coeruleus TaxID=5963 RepID=A0A1R2CJK0_9CILI|nr:hypothetical protein SteCoe_8721 [Stentor coeruleus]
MARRELKPKQLSAPITGANQKDHFCLNNLKRSISFSIENSEAFSTWILVQNFSDTSVKCFAENSTTPCFSPAPDFLVIEKESLGEYFADDTCEEENIKHIRNKVMVFPIKESLQNLNKKKEKLNTIEAYTSDDVGVYRLCGCQIF